MSFTFLYGKDTCTQSGPLSFVPYSNMACPTLTLPPLINFTRCIHSSMLSSGVSVIDVMSAASQSTCWLVLTPPTFEFNSLQRYPEPTLIGLPYASRNGSNILIHNVLSLSIPFSSGVLSILYLFAVADLVISSSVKCSDNFIYMYSYFSIMSPNSSLWAV